MIEDDIESEPVVEEGDPIHIPKPVQKTIRKPVNDLEFHDLGAKYAIGIHWGTFKLTLEQMDEPPRRLESTLRRQNMTDGRFKVMAHGEDWSEVFIR